MPPAKEATGRGEAGAADGTAGGAAGGAAAGEAGGEAAGEADTLVQASRVSDFKARCLCAHPRLPLYLAGGDGVVQCWQFGQTIQGRGFEHHLRSACAEITVHFVSRRGLSQGL